MKQKYLNQLLSNLKTGIKKNSGRSKGQLVIKSRGNGLKYNYKYINLKLSKRPFSVLKLINTSQHRSKALLISYTFNRFFSPFLINYIKAFEGAFCGQFLNHNLNYNFPGKVTKLKNCLVGERVHLIESSFSTGGTYVRSNNTFAKILNQLKNITILLLPSKKQIYLNNNFYCIIGTLYKSPKVKKYKAGQNKLLNLKPKVRGLAMNCVDHPMGGGRGKSKSNKSPRTPYGKIIKK
jgi:large subunit ribosomal protein L2